MTSRSSDSATPTRRAWRAGRRRARAPWSRSSSTTSSPSTPTSWTCSSPPRRTPTSCAGARRRVPRAGAEAVGARPRRCRAHARGARRSGATLRVLEDYLFYPPLVKLRDLIVAGEIGTPVSAHMKIVATGRGGWDLPEQLEWQFEQARDGRGMMVFDHGWHQLAVASWLFGPIRRIFAWLGRTEIVPGIEMDAPSTLVWEHENGVRAVLEITLRRRHVLPLERLHRRRARRGHRHAWLRAEQPDQRAGHPGTGGPALPRWGDPRVPRPRRPPTRRVPHIDRATRSRSSGGRSTTR